MRKVVLYIACTLDGYIASDDDQLDFLKPFEHSGKISEHIESFMESVDTVVMGRMTYDFIKAFEPWPYSKMTSIVVSHQDIKDHRIMLTKDPIQAIKEQKEMTGKSIWVLGGGLLIQSLLNMNLIDEFIIAITPTLLGSGKRLFHPLDRSIELQFEKSEVIDGLPILTWTKR